MKTKAFLASLLSLCLLVTSIYSSVFAEEPDKWRNEKSHNRWTQAMIFGNMEFTYAKDSTIVQKVQVLENAVLLCIDQYNSSYSDKLTSLKDAGISGLPSSIEEINFSAGTDHRRYTHRGWDYRYSDSEKSKSKPDIRRTILLNSVESVFQFEKAFSSADQADRTRNAMCCFLYITHVLGDRFHSKTYYGADSTLLLADDSNAETVISDLLKYLPILFPNHKGSTEYRTIVNKLNSYSGEIIRSHRQYPEKDDWLRIDREYAEKIKDLLRDNIPALLKQQAWFTNVFPLSCWNGI